MMPVVTLAVHLLAADPAGYAKPDLLVSAETLARPGAAGKFHVLDVRSLGKYETGHVPGAVSAPLSRWSKATTAGTAAADFWKAELAAVGVTPTKPVVVYADDVREACRGWWLLLFAGVPDVRVLDGGWAAFTAAGGAVQKEAVAAKAPPHDWKPAADRQADKADVIRMTREKKGSIIDARSEDEFKAGRIPGAVRLEWSELIDEKTQRFKPAAEIGRLFKERNIDPAAETCSY
jgi:thiosulfate/3-mercaptopyruvate sulfurtransferase